MKYFIFISPHFPDHFYKFVAKLKDVGFCVLGIGDMPYDNLPNHLKENLYDYYACFDMDNFDSEVEAVRYFVNKYGHIDYLESNNEYWLLRDAKLRDMFNIDGVRENELSFYQHKSLMKEKFAIAGVKTAKWIIYKDEESLREFVKDVNYPIFIKPDSGVGASGDYKIKNDDDLSFFLNNKDPNTTYICEQFIDGTIISYDGVADDDSNPVFECDNIFPPSISDILTEQKDLFYYAYQGLVRQLKDVGHKVLKAFNVKKRFFHIEFFLIRKAIKGFADAGDIVALETNMRPAGGYTTDMINYANSWDCYKIYAEIMMNNFSSFNKELDKFYVACVGRRNNKQYVYSDDDLVNKFNICNRGEYAPIFRGVMGDRFLMCKCTTMDELNDFKDYALLTNNSPIIDHYHQRKNKNLTGEDIDMMNEDKKEQNNIQNSSICDTNIDGA